jgi:hypothetical protein
MDAGTCVLLLTYKRFDNLKQNLELILKYTNFPIYISIDGPKKGENIELHRLIQEIELINELNRITIIFYWQNQGLKNHLIMAVKDIFQRHRKIIVIEDDSSISQKFLDFIQCYSSFDLDGVAHYSGFSPLSRTVVRENLHRAYKSKYISSYAWATSKEYFEEFDGSIDFRKCIMMIWRKYKFLGLYEKIIWSIYSFAARYKIVDSWAIPWTLYLWQYNLTCLSPTCNLVEYKLDQVGTHSKLKSRYIPEKPCQENHSWDTKQFIESYDKEISRIVYRSDLSGIFVTIVSVLYRLFKKILNV